MLKALTFDEERAQTHRREAGPGTSPTSRKSPSSPPSATPQRAWAPASSVFALAVALASLVLPLANGVVMAKDEAPVKGFEDFDPKNFDRSTVIDNPWMPLKPGTRFTYKGTNIEDDGTPVPHQVVITITDLTKVISGIRSVVSWDLDYSDGELVEAENAFYAQDNDGTVWRLGEYPEEYEDGKFVRAPAWLHGSEGAVAGIEMRASPQPGTPSYSQGWAPAVNFTDRGQVDQTGQKTCVPVKCYDDVLVIAEVNGEEKDAQQLKHFARRVGNILVTWRGKGEKTKETLQLVSVEQLDVVALAEARAGALKLEKSAYDRSKTIYAHTLPAEHPAAAKSDKPTTPKEAQR